MKDIKKWIIAGLLLGGILPLACMQETITLDSIDEGSATLNNEALIPLTGRENVNIYVPLKYVRYATTLEHVLQDTGISLLIKNNSRVIQETPVTNIGVDILGYIFTMLVPELEKENPNLASVCDDYTLLELMDVLIAVNYLDIKKDLLRKLVRYCAARIDKDPKGNDIQEKLHGTLLPLPVLKMLIKELAHLKLGCIEDNQSIVLSKHARTVNSVCAVETQEGCRIVSGSGDNTVGIWAMSGNQIAICNGHTGLVRSVCAVETKEGWRIISGSYDNTVRIWDMSGNQIAVCNGHTSLVLSVCAVETKEGWRIVSGSRDNTVRIWDMSGKETAVCNGHTDWVTSVCAVETKKGWRIVSGSGDNTVGIWAMSGNQIAICNGHTGLVRSVCAVETKEGWRIISGSYDNTVRIWDMSGNQIAVCNGHTGSVRSVCAVETKDGCRIVSGSLDKTVRIWDMSGNQIAICNGHTDWVTSVCAVETQDGCRIVSGSFDKTVRIWDTLSFWGDLTRLSREGLKKIYMLFIEGHGKETLYIKIKEILKQPQEEKKKQLGGILPLACMQETITLDSIDEGSATLNNEALIPLTGRENVNVYVPLKYVRYATTLEHVLQDTGISLLIKNNSRVIQETPVTNIGVDILGYIFTMLVPELEKENPNLASVCDDYTLLELMDVLIAVNYLDIKKDLLRKLVRYCAARIDKDPKNNDIQEKLHGTLSPLPVLKMLIKELAHLKLGCIEDNQSIVLSKHARTVNSVCAVETQEGCRIVSGSGDNTVGIWAMSGNQIAICNGHTGLVRSVCAVETKEGWRIISGSYDNTVRIWDMSGNQIAVCNGHTSLVLSVCAVETKEGWRIVSGSRDNTVRIWDMSGKETAVCNGHTDWVTSVCAVETKKGWRIISGSMDNTVRIWDMSGNQLAVCNGHTGSVDSVCAVQTKEGCRVISGSDDETVRIWDMRGNQLAVCNGHTGWVASVCGVETEEGCRIVSGSGDKTVRIWDMTGKHIATCNGHTFPVDSVCAVKTKDGWCIVSGSHDKTVRIWDMSGNQLAVCNGHTNWVNSVCAVQTKEGCRIISGSDDKTVRIWDPLSFWDYFNRMPKESLQKIYILLTAGHSQDALYIKVQEIINQEKERLLKNKQEKESRERFVRITKNNKFGFFECNFHVHKRDN